MAFLFPSGATHIPSIFEASWACSSFSETDYPTDFLATTSIYMSASFAIRLLPFQTNSTKYHQIFSTLTPPCHLQYRSPDFDQVTYMTILPLDLSLVRLGHSYQHRQIQIDEKLMLIWIQNVLLESPILCNTSKIMELRRDQIVNPLALP